MVHLTASSALVHLACDHRNVLWAIHGITLVTSLVCVACIWIGVTLFRRGPNGPGHGSVHFLGVFAATIAAVNLLVIIWEGSYVVFLSPCR